MSELRASNVEADMNTVVRRLGVLALATILVACSDKSGDGSTAGSGTSLGTVAARNESGIARALPFTKQLKDIGLLTDLIVAEANELPRAEFDTEALVASLGKDPQKLFEWVRDRTFWAPYRGLLRGGKGVMLDRVGSSVDRAVLLGDLLRRSGFAVRLAHASLTAPRAAELLSRVRPLPADRRVSDGLRSPSAERQRRIDAVMSHDSGDLEAQIANSRQILADATDLARSQGDTLLAIIKNSNATAQTGTSGSVAALRDHWWVEYQQDGRWIPLDVLLPEAKVGDRLAEPISTISWSPDREFPAIPDSNWHTVGVRVVIERYQAGATSEIKVLEATIRPAETIDRPIVLGHVPSPWPDNTRLLGGSPESARAAALGVRKWVPLLQIGRESVVQSGFSNTGDLESGMTSSGASALGQGVTGTMDMTLSFGGEEPKSSVTAEWIDYDINVPGEPTQRLRRPVFDLLGPARRTAKFADFNASAEDASLQRAMAMLGQTEILLQPCAFSEAFVAHLASASIVANRAAFVELSKTTDPEKARNLLSKIVGDMSFWGPLPNFGRLRSVLGGSGADWYIDRANVINHRFSQSLVGTKSVLIQRVLDVASNGIGARAGTSRSPFEVRVRQGVADTVAEMVTLGSDLAAAANTASVFSRLGRANSRGFVIGARDDAAVRKLPWPDDELFRVGADVTAGYMVVVPREAVQIDGEPHVAWWRVDPNSGETIGVMDTGLHGAAEDTALANSLNSLRIKLFTAYLAAGGAGVSGGKGLMDLTNQLLQRMDTLIEVLSTHPVP
jgi:hypothetical protein